jgi:hypothetical protein
MRHGSVPGRVRWIVQAVVKRIRLLLTRSERSAARLIDVVRELRVLANTVLFCNRGDNGAGIEGGLSGALATEPSAH